MIHLLFSNKSYTHIIGLLCVNNCKPTQNYYFMQLCAVDEMHNYVRIRQAVSVRLRFLVLLKTKFPMRLISIISCRGSKSLPNKQNTPRVIKIRHKFMHSKRKRTTVLKLDNSNRN